MVPLDDGARGAEIDRLAESLLETVASDDEPFDPHAETPLARPCRRSVMPRREDESLHREAIAGRSPRMAVGDDDWNRGACVESASGPPGTTWCCRGSHRSRGAAAGIEVHHQRPAERDVGTSTTNGRWSRSCRRAGWRYHGTPACDGDQNAACSGRELPSLKPAGARTAIASPIDGNARRPLADPRCGSPRGGRCNHRDSNEWQAGRGDIDDRPAIPDP